MAALEDGIGATATASGHAAQILAVFPLMEPGAEVIASNRLYGGSINQMAHSYKKFGWVTKFAEATDPDSFAAQITDKTRAIFVECLANPGGVIVDIKRLGEIAHEAGIPLIVDNTLATPYLLRPFEFGADIVIHSTTKFLSGQGNALGGVVVDSGKFRFQQSEIPLLCLHRQPEYHGLSFRGEFRQSGLYHVWPCRGAARFGPGPAADECLPDPEWD